LLEVAVCITIYACVPLLLENLPPLFEYVIYEYPKWRGIAESCERAMTKVYPFIIGFAYVLPLMHQSSLGALMLLGGDKVYPLWQSPWLPLIYVWAAAFLGYNCVVLCLLLAKLAWTRDLDGEDSPGFHALLLLPPVLDRNHPDCGIGLRPLLGEG
jgi:Ni/Fe-hydrogenase subunit HybB-like protein